MSLLAKLDINVLFGSNELIEPEVNNEDMVVWVIRYKYILRFQVVVIYPFLSGVLDGW